MLELKEAIKKGFDHFHLIYEGHQFPNILLEEIEYDNLDDTWNVVIGFDSNRTITKIEKPGAATVSSMFANTTTVKEKERKYKRIVIKREDGSFVKMTDD